ncbi:class I SAM-dependent methyltransferase [Pandoraea apista]|uniref:Class I SAM-dependent methyltransferase n=1 Tax=Pandoraea apista TaxID=93218 RepID=A0A5E5P064_9BURK|nr:SAM-dependent methyltransferase [Pandoraea apista]VVG69948.1 class I SAM-dependent methyltransferase [Pandoraea apista]
MTANEEGDHVNIRHEDGSAGDANYGAIGEGYTAYRQPDPHIEGFVRRALGCARLVLNVGAGAGSYEPVDREVTAVEPSASMRAQRPPHLPAAIDAVAQSLPFADDTFDASMATFSVHQWPDLSAGLSEMRRVTRGVVLILSCDPARLGRSWLADYAPEMIEVEARRYPAIQAIVDGLGGHAEVVPVEIPLHCTDGFSEAYYGRPERLLEPGARRANSAWSFVEPGVQTRFAERLRRDLEDGAWDRKYGSLRTQPTFDGSLRLIVAAPEGESSTFHQAVAAR